MPSSESNEERERECNGKNATLDTNVAFFPLQSLSLSSLLSLDGVKPRLDGDGMPYPK